MKFSTGICRRASAAALCLCLAGCSPSAAPSTPRVVVYTSIDQPFAEEILRRFRETTGIEAVAAFDSEAGKTTGFVRRLMREAHRPACDVWWSSELFGTIELARQGVLEAYDSPSAADIPAAWRDKAHRWTGVAARARVLAFDASRVAPDDVPRSWREIDPARWGARLVLANPQFGTTRGHVAAILAYWGDAAATEFLTRLRDARTPIADSNSHAVRLVVGGSADVCWTDTDDVWVSQKRSESLDLVYPVLGPDLPPMWIPCSVALVRGGPNPKSARSLIDFLVSAEAERLLALTDSRNVPVRAALARELELDDPAPQPLDFDRVADALPAAMKTAREILLQ